MKRNFFLGLIVLALTVTASSWSATGDQGRRLAGPFCVGKANLSPFYVKHTGWISRAGVVRSVSITEQCQPTELRKFGVAVPDENGGVGIAGPKGDKGDTGAQGAKGDTGAAGPAGADGKDGKDGSVTGTIAVCASEGGNLKLCGGDNGHDPVGYLVLTTD